MLKTGRMFHQILPAIPGILNRNSSPTDICQIDSHRHMFYKLALSEHITYRLNSSLSTHTDSRDYHGGVDRSDLLSRRPLPLLDGPLSCQLVASRCVHSRRELSAVVQHYQERNTLVVPITSHSSMISGQLTTPP